MTVKQTSRSGRTWVSPLRKLVLIGVAVLLLGPWGVPAGAQPETAEAVPFVVRSYALDYSVTHEEAQRRLDRIRPIQEILASIRDIESGRLAGWGIDHTADFNGWVWLTGHRPPHPEAARIANAHTDINIRLGARYSLAQLINAQESLFGDGALGSITEEPGADASSIVTFTGIDMRANAVRVGIDPALATPAPGVPLGIDPTPITDSAFQTAAAELTRVLQTRLNVNIQVEDGRGLSDSTNFRGGETMRGVENNEIRDICTAGFIARHRRTGAYGVITAGHCENRATMIHGISLPQMEIEQGPYVDAQFRRIPAGANHRAFASYLCSGYDPCHVVDDVSRFHMMNDFICHYGIVTHLSCGTVVDIRFAPENALICADAPNGVTCFNTFVRVEGNRLNACRGDSGGPWHDVNKPWQNNNGSAYGILSGATLQERRGRNHCMRRDGFAFFSTVENIEERLGVDILTGVDRFVTIR